MFWLVDISQHSDLFFSKRLWGFFIDFQLLISTFLCSVALIFSLPDCWYERYKNLMAKSRKGNARKAKVRKFWYLLGYYCDYDCTCYFSGNCSIKHCHCSKSGQVCTDFCQPNVEVCETLIYWWGDEHWRTFMRTLMSISEHWCPHFGRSMYSAVI